MSPPSGVTALARHPSRFDLRGICLLGDKTVIPALMDKEASDASWPGVQVLVAAPHSPVYTPIVERERNVTDRVSQVPATNTALGDE